MRCLWQRAGALAVLLAVAALAGTCPQRAAAHGGYPVLEERDETYAVAVLVSAVPGREREALDLTTYLVRQDLGEPDLEAEVELRITDDKGTRVLRPKVITDGYETVLAGEPSAWRRWRIEVRVSGAAGDTVAVAEPRETYTGVPLVLVVALGAATVVIGVISIAVLRRRVRRAEAAGAGKSADGAAGADGEVAPDGAGGPPAEGPVSPN